MSLSASKKYPEAGESLDEYQDNLQTKASQLRNFYKREADNLRHGSIDSKSGAGMSELSAGKSTQNTEFQKAHIRKMQQEREQEIY